MGWVVVIYCGLRENCSAPSGKSRTKKSTLFQPMAWWQAVFQYVEPKAWMDGDWLCEFVCDSGDFVPSIRLLDDCLFAAVAFRLFPFGLWAV